jgi:hypothetical protein
MVSALGRMNKNEEVQDETYKYENAVMDIVCFYAAYFDRVRG